MGTLSSLPQAIDASRVQNLEEAREVIARLQADLVDSGSRHAQELRLRDLRIQDLLQRLYGPKSEKLPPLDPAQLELLSDFVAPPVDPAMEEIVTEDPAELERTPRRRAARHPLPENLETEVVRLEPEEKTCPHCGEAKCVLGEDVREELDYVPAKLIRRQIVRPRMACQHCVKTTVQAPAPAQLIDRGMAGAGLVAQVVLAKYVDHLPLYRQQQQFLRLGANLPRQRLCDWVEKAAEWMQPLYRLLLEDLQKGDYLQIDETPVRVIDPEVKGKTARGQLWLGAKPGGDVVFHFDPSRGKTAALTLLENFSGILQSDAYVVYESLARNNPKIIRIGCWAHVRRKFVEALKDDTQAATAFLQDIQGLYRIEKEAREKLMDFPARQKLREEKAPRLLDRMKARLDTLQPKTLPKSPLGQAIGYALNEWPGLGTYVGQGLLEIDNNLIENALRPVGIGRKNWLFLGHPDAGWRSAVIYSLVGSCKRRGIDPARYLTDILRRLPSTKPQQLPQLLPANWKPA